MTLDVCKVHKYLLEHPSRSSVFPAWTDEQILDTFEKSLAAGGAHVGVGDGDKIFGCVITFPHHDAGYLYVTAFFVEDRGFWPGVMQAMFERYPYYHIAGRVGGKPIMLSNSFLRRQFLSNSRN